ncbi:MAG: phosphatase PAP2 family protein [Ruminococcaceae bacterium]|nr:phosphatase PAP2 family protein [Oscillospiraceae bacterium]
MKKTGITLCAVGSGFLTAFVLWTVLVRIVDVADIGAKGTSVGFSTVNGFIHGLTGVNMLLYTVTDWLGLVPLAVCVGFAALGLVQLIKRKSLLAVDRSILLLGAFYTVVIIMYVFFEFAVVNYRPVLIDGRLEASYPSSTTLLVTCVMLTAIMQLSTRIKSVTLKRCITLLIVLFIVFMVVARVLSGVHWFTDIIGGILLSTGLVAAYYGLSSL